MSKLSSGVITPAYGRDYKSLKDVQADFDAGKDFRWQSFDGEGIVNREDFVVGAKIQARYAKVRKVGMVTVKAQAPEVPFHSSARPSLTVGAVLDFKEGK